VNPALKLVQEFYALLASGHAPEALGLLDSDVEWAEAERSPYYRGVLRGVEAVISTVLNPIAADFDDFAATPCDFISELDRVAAFGVYTGSAKVSGRKLRAPFVHVWTVQGGHIMGFLQHTDSGAWNEALQGR
jgi:ketosteroid isomerase-like protein